MPRTIWVPKECRDLVKQVSKIVEFQDIRLHSLSVNNRRPINVSASQDRLTLKSVGLVSTPKMVKEWPDIYILLDFIVHTQDDFQIFLSFVSHYKSDAKNLSLEVVTTGLDEFAKTGAMYDAWPYLRAETQQISNKFDVTIGNKGSEVLPLVLLKEEKE